MRDPLVYFLAALVVIAFGFLIVLVRRAPTEKAARPWLRIEVAHTHTFAALPLRIRHELAPNSIQDVFEDGERLVRGYFDALRAHERLVPTAQPLTMPPEPEERIARDIQHARAISRGAQRLMDAARDSGIVLSHEQALREASDMYNSRMAED